MVVTVSPYRGFRLLKRPHERSQIYLFGFLGLSFLSNVVFLLKNPVRLVLVCKHLNLIQRSNIRYRVFFYNRNESPISKKTSNTVAALYIINSKISVLPIKGKQFLKFKVNNEISSLLVQDVARLIEFLLFTGCYSDARQCLTNFQEVIRFIQKNLHHLILRPINRRFYSISHLRPPMSSRCLM